MTLSLSGVLSANLFAKQAFVAIAVLAFYNPCTKKDDGSDAGDAMAVSDAAPADAAPAALPEPVAKNAGKVGRFPTDTSLNMEKEKLQAEATIVRESPGGGPWVGTLKKDTEVTKVVAHGDNYILIAFPDPKAPADTLEGWINKNAFTAGAAVVAPVGGKCAIKGQVFFTGAACKYECSTAIACPAGFTCSGMGSRPDKAGEGSPYCEAAGGVVDAGAPAPISCSGGLMMGTDNKCHTKCTTNKDCNGGKGVCTPFGSLKGCVP